MSSSDKEEPLPISFADVQESMGRIRQHVAYTPVMECSYFNSQSRFQLYFKCENFQSTGAFKIRGATNAVKKLCESLELPVSERKEKGPIVVTHSSGNHAQALSRAARTCGVTAQVVMPRTSPTVKVQAVRGYGGTPIFCEPTEKARFERTEQLMQSLGPRAVLIPSANHPDVMAGQGTVAMEFLEQVSDLDAIISGVSCGGLMAGICVAARALKPGIKLYAAEPEGADDCARSMAAGYRIANEIPPQTIADGLRMSIGDLTWPVLKTHLNGVFVVSDEEIVTTMRLVWERMKLVIEPSAACPLAVVLSQQFEKTVGAEVKKVGVVFSGGNVDLDHLPWIK